MKGMYDSLDCGGMQKECPNLDHVARQRKIPKLSIFVSVACWLMVTEVMGGERVELVFSVYAKDPLHEARRIVAITSTKDIKLSISVSVVCQLMFTGSVWGMMLV